MHRDTPYNEIKQEIKI